MKQKALLFIIFLLSALTASAYDIQIDGIYYNLDTSAQTATVTYKQIYNQIYYSDYTGSVTIPPTVTYNGATYNVKSIGDRAFISCSDLTSIIIPNGVTSIGWSAFKGCSGLISVTIPNSVTSIDWYAFDGCSSLTSVTIPNSVTEIGNEAFRDCSGLTDVTVESENKKYDSRDNCNAIIATASNTLIAGCKNTVIPNSVTSIGGSAFYNCSGLISVTIPNSVTSIGGSAFYNCSGLTEVIIPNSVTSIGNYAFYGCSGLTSVTIPNGVTAIGYRAFDGCSGLTSVTIPNSVTSIGKQAFYNCSSLTSVEIPNSVTSIGDYAFYNCSSIDDIYNYCTTPQNIGSNTFSNYSATLHVVKGYKSSYGTTYYWKNFTIVEDFDIEINGSCGDNANYSLDTKTGLLLITGTGAMTNYSNVSSVPWYPQREFIKEVEISDGITSIGNYTLYGCTNLTSVTIPNNVTSIAKYSFYNCKCLKSVTIPNSVTTIGDYAFSGCSSLTDIYNYRVTPQSIGSNTFSIYSATLHIGKGCKSLYNATNWKNFTIEEDFDIEINGSCGDNSNYSLDTKAGLLSITGTGEMTNYSSEGSVPWYPQREFVKEVEISDGITSIGGYALYGCTNLTSVNIPNGVTSIEDFAFEGCINLTSVQITDIAAWCNISFSNISSNPLYLAKHLIMDDKEITDLIIPEGVASIGNYVFYGCSEITSIIIPSSVKSIGESAFANCSELVDVYCYARKGPTAGNDIFDNSGIQFATLHVPEVSISGYRITTPWNRFGSIVALQDSDPKPEPKPEPTPEYIRGDVNLDGIVNGTDIQEIINIIIGGE